ncbi:MAG: hemolysin III family protein [Balneolaceae bacterium]|nr:hemolysin III family protein [Balneolaceae bacterium]
MYHGERFNSYTHLIGSIASAIGLGVLIYIAAQKGGFWRITSFTIYGLSLLSLYTCSTLYHSFRGKWKTIFRKLDHISIYLLIAGTYTPFTLITLRGDIGWLLFGIVWGLAAIGIIIDLLHKSGSRILQVAIYLGMGWIAFFLMDTLINRISVDGVNWLMAGGLFYTTGVIFFALSDKHRLAHGIWHLFVLAGSLSHFVTIVLFV